jgi:hypothetical protein
MDCSGYLPVRNACRRMSGKPARWLTGTLQNYKKYMENNWRDKSIETLEKRSYGDPASAPSNIVRLCLEYVKLPVGDLDIEQVQLLIGQEIGLTYLIPLAMEFLKKDILAEGNYYPGDLLKKVTTVNVVFWKTNVDLYQQLLILIKQGEQKIAQEGLAITFPNL